MELVAGVWLDFDVLLALVCGGGFALAFALGTQRMNGFVAVTLFLIGPLAAVATWALVNPDPGCTDDCPGKLGLGFLLLFATFAWWAGLTTGAIVGSAVRRRSSN
jgi:hypothetical protein